MEEGRLRAVSDSESAGSPGAEGSGAPREPYRLASILLAVALVLSLVLLAWSRSQLGGRIDRLERETVQLEQQVEGRERVIRAHRERLDAVRGHLSALQELVEEPLPDAP